MDGINSQGSSVSLLADDESPDPEPSGRPQVGLSEQQIVRYLLDTCSTVDEAKQALLLAKQYYLFVPVPLPRRGRDWTRLRLGVLAGSQHRAHRRRRPRLDVKPWCAPTICCTAGRRHGHSPMTHRSGVAGQHVPTLARVSTPESPTAVSSIADAAREHLASVAFTAPDPAVRTLWNVVYDLESLHRRRVLLPARP